MFNTFFLYTITALIWGSTWYAIQFQLTTVSPLWSITYRFALASLLLISFCLITKQNLKFSAKNHLGMATQGLLLFCLNYIFFYYGSGYLISGIVAVLFANIQMMNIIHSRIIFKAPLKLSVILSAMIGIAGLCMVFISEMSKIYPHHASNKTQQLIGLAFCLVATVFASWGNMASAYNQKNHLPVLQTNAIGMFYGALFTVIIALFLGQKPTMSWTLPYLGSLIYLSVLGSIIAFGSYLKLLGQIGPGRAAYIFVITPIIALIISSLLEGFAWHFVTIVGVILVITGNILALYKPDLSIKLEEKSAANFDIPAPLPTIAKE